MQSAITLTTFLGALLSLINLTVAQLSNVTTPSLNLTAITALNSSSVLECWQLPGFAASVQAGTSGALNLFLGNATNVSYTVIPARFDGGMHRAPAAQYVVASILPRTLDEYVVLLLTFVYFTSGLAHITLPNTTESANTSVWIQGGKYGLIIAADTSDVSTYGHITTYPSDADTAAIQIAFANGLAPDHTVLHNGPCIWEEMVGL